MRATLSIIIPTLGRASLSRTLCSVAPQLSAEDEVLIVGDGPRPWVPPMIDPFGSAFRYLETPSATRNYGCSQRNLGMSAARNDYVAFMDDDDVYLPNALEAMRRRILDSYLSLFVFRMRHNGHVLWKTPELTINNVSTQMYCFPNRPDRLGRWRMNPYTQSGRGDDHLFASDTVALWPPGSLVFVDEVIAELLEHSYGAEPAETAKE